MENDKGLNVDLYIPRKWCVGAVRLWSPRWAVRARAAAPCVRATPIVPRAWRALEWPLLRYLCLRR